MTKSHRQLVLASLVVAALVCVAGAAYLRVRAVETSAVPAPPARHQPLLEVEPARLAEFVRDRYLVRPDRRFLLAVADTYRLTTGAPVGAVIAERAGDGWRIKMGGREMGTLPQFPSFEAEVALLRGLATGSASSSSPTSLEPLRHAVREVNADAIVVALAALNSTYASHRADGELVRAASAAFTWLSVIDVDSLDQGDALYAWALALVAREKALGSPDAAEHTALLAHAMGYEAASIAAASELSPENPVRLFADRDVKHLAATCSSRAADRQCEFLQLLLLAERWRLDRFWGTVAASSLASGPTLEGLGLAVRLPDFEQHQEAGRALANLVLSKLQVRPVTQLLRMRWGNEPATRAGWFEPTVASHAASRNGELLPAEVTTAFYRSLYYSGVYQQAKLALLDSRLPAEAARVVQSIDATTGTAADLEKWLAVSAQTARASELEPLDQAIPRLRWIGGAPLAALAKRLAEQSGNLHHRKQFPALFAELDSRPADLAIAANIAEHNLISPSLLEVYASAAAAAAPHRSAELAAVAALMRGDAARLKSIADDGTVGDYARTTALWGLQTFGREESEFVVSRYETLATRLGDQIDPLVKYLEKQDDLDSALRAVRRVRNAYGSRDLDGAARLVAAEARILLLKGKANEAWNLIQPVPRAYWTLPLLLEGAAVQLARERGAEALELARQAIEADPQSIQAAATRARAQWALGDYAGAAHGLAHSPSGIVGDYPTDLAEAFTTSFRAAPAETTRRAFDELRRAGIAPHVLSAVARDFGYESQRELASSLIASLHDPAPEWQACVLTDGYDLVRRTSGPEAALTWIRAQLPEPDHQFALTAFQRHEYEMLLGVFPIGSAGVGRRSDKARVIRLLQAASLLALDERESPRRTALVAETHADPDQSNTFVRMARVLLRDADGAVLFGSVHDVTDVASVGWALGMRAAADGKLEEAERWYQVSLESAVTGEPPTAWAFTTMGEWLGLWRSPTVLEQHPDMMLRNQTGGHSHG